MHFSRLAIWVYMCRDAVKKSRAQQLIYLATVLLYILSILSFRNPSALTPDEMWFFDIVSQKTTAELYSSFTLAYGGLFWAVVKLAYSTVGIENTRYLFSFVLCAPLLACMRLQSIKQRLASLALWAGMPMAWWYGKIVSPDSLNVLIIAACASSAIFKKERLAFFLVGTAIGVKLNAVAAAPFVIAILYSSNKTVTTKRILSIFISGAAGLFISSPVFLIDPLSAISTLQQFSSVASNHLQMIKSISLTSKPTWDMIYTIGIFSSSIAMAGYLLTIAFGIFKKDELIISTIFSFLSCGLILSTASAALGWYWMPFLVVFFIAVTHSSTAKNSYIIAALGALIALGNAPEAYRSALTQISHNDRMKNMSEYTKCISEQAEKIYERGPVYIRSFGSFERNVAESTSGKIIASGYPGSVGEATRATSQHDTFIVDSAVISADLYPSLISAPRICNGAFAVDKSNRTN